MDRNGHDEIQDKFKDFVDEVQRVGYTHLENVLEHVPEPERNLSLFEDLLRQLEDAGIEVYGYGESVVTEADEPDHLTYIAEDDAITLYFREVSTVPLLSREQEVALARQIEQGEAAKQKLEACEKRRAGAGGRRPSETSVKLSPEERAALEQAIEAGEKARHMLITANTRLVISLAKNYLGQGVPLLDLIQEGNIGLMRAAEKFEWRRGYKFSTYATWWIRQALTRAVADQGRTIRLPIHRHEQVRKLRKASRELTKALGRTPSSEELAEELGKTPGEVARLMQDAQPPMSLEKPAREYAESRLGDLLESDDPLPIKVAEDEALAKDIQELLSALPSREARIIELRYGLRDGREYTLKEIGERFGLTRERIRQIENDALHRLRSPRRLQKLQAYLA